MAEVVEETTETIEETLAKSGGESVEILLSKEANSEQLEIAKKIEKYNFPNKVEVFFSVN